MRYAVIANHAAKAVFLLAVSLYVAVPAVSAQQVKGSHIEVMVCPQGSQSGFTIESPVSDSIVVSPTVRISGTVQSISQIDFYVDDIYNNTLAVGRGEQSYASDVSMNPGTHTIRLTAIDSCAQQTHQASIVVTFQPQAQPSTGKDTETKLSAAIPTTGSSGNTETAASASQEQTGQSGAGSPALPSIVRRALDSLDIGNGAPDVNGLSDAAKAGSAVTGLVMLAGVPLFFQSHLLHAYQLRHQRSLRKLHKAAGTAKPTPRLRRIGLALEIIGMLLVILPFVV